MILEAIVSTINTDGTANVSPMGPTVTPGDTTFAQFELRPFDTSRTFENLKRTRQGVMHITDDVLLFAKSAISRLDPLPAMDAASKINGFVLNETCRWYEFEVESIDESGTRKSLFCKTVFAGRHRDFFGFSRAKHAVLEAAILATRLDFLPPEDIQRQFNELATIVQKTAGPQETEAFELLNEYVQR